MSVPDHVPPNVYSTKFKFKIQFLEIRLEPDAPTRYPSVYHSVTVPLLCMLTMCMKLH